jgi:S1-C subfamily serine protease
MKTLLVVLALLASIAGGGFLSLPSLKAYVLSEPLPPMDAAVMVITATGSGSGIHIGDGQILTAAHVVQNDKTVLIKNEAGKLIAGVKVVWRDRVLDLALLQIETAAAFEVDIAPLDCAPNFPGQKVTLIGAPLGLALMFTKGLVIHVDVFDRLVLDATGLFGMSGGGVIDASGHTVGIIVAVMVAGDSEGIAAFTFAVPAHVICARMAQE